MVLWQDITCHPVFVFFLHVMQHQQHKNTKVPFVEPPPAENTRWSFIPSVTSSDLSLSLRLSETPAKRSHMSQTTWLHHRKTHEHIPVCCWEPVWLGFRRRLNPVHWVGGGSSEVTNTRTIASVKRMLAKTITLCMWICCQIELIALWDTQQINCLAFMSALTHIWFHSHTQTHSSATRNPCFFVFFKRWWSQLVIFLRQSYLDGLSCWKFSV